MGECDHEIMARLRNERDVLLKRVDDLHSGSVCTFRVVEGKDGKLCGKHGYLKEDLWRCYYCIGLVLCLEHAKLHFEGHTRELDEARARLKEIEARDRLSEGDADADAEEGIQP